MITGVSSDLFIDKTPNLQMGSLAQRLVVGSGYCRCRYFDLVIATRQQLVEAANILCYLLLWPASLNNIVHLDFLRDPKDKYATTYIYMCVLRKAMRDMTYASGTVFVPWARIMRVEKRVLKIQ